MNNQKFKVYDKTYHRYLTQDEVLIRLDGTFTVKSNIYTLGSLQDFIRQCDLLSYIPVSEYNDKDVYEGDLVRFCNEDGDCILGTFEFVNDPDEEGTELWCGWKLKKLKDITSEWYDDQDNWLGDKEESKWDGNICIVGNIYDNKEMYETSTTYSTTTTTTKCK